MDQHRNFVSGSRTGTGECASQETIPGKSMFVADTGLAMSRPQVGGSWMPSTGAGFCPYLHVSKRNKDRLCDPLGCHSTLGFLTPSPSLTVLTEAGPFTPARLN